MFLSMADPHPGAGYLAPWDFREPRLLVTTAEAQSCALLQRAGMSWDVIASYNETSRQAIHRRMAALADAEWIKAQRNEAQNRKDLASNLSDAVYTASYLTKYIYEEIESAPAVWEDRSHRRGWWHG
jgi:hypothetical protein